MSVVARHSNTKYITGMSDKPVSGLTSVEIPQTHGVVPASGQSEVVVRGQTNFLNEMAMAGEDSSWNGFHTSYDTSLLRIDVKIPDQKSLVTRD